MPGLRENTFASERIERELSSKHRRFPASKETFVIPEAYPRDLGERANGFRLSYIYVHIRRAAETPSVIQKVSDDSRAQPDFN